MHEPAHCLPHGLFWLPRLKIVLKGLLNSIMESVVPDGDQPDSRVSQTEFDVGPRDGDNEAFPVWEGDNFLDVVGFCVEVRCNVLFCCFSVLKVVAWVSEE